MPRIRRAAALLAVFALVAAGCGDTEAAKDGSKATSTPDAKKSAPSGY